MKRIVLIFSLLFIVKNYGSNYYINEINIDIIEYNKMPDTKYLYKCVYTESRGEPRDGQKAIVDVILNRVNSNKFPNTIDSVILQKNQFACNKRLCVPDSFKLRIDKFVMEYKKSSYLYFLNPETATNHKMIRMSEKRKSKQIGNHVFF
jgi:N-acetylmuramoyl-L-alanine amidase